MSSKPLKIFVPRLIDERQTNAQNLNAKALLSRFSSPNIEWHTVYYHEPDPAVANRPNVICHKLARGRFWTYHLMLKYSGAYDAIFYPGCEWYDAAGLNLRRLLFKRIPIIATMEGLPGADEREKLLSDVAGHTVHCFRPRSGSTYTSNFDKVHGFADAIIAISPFMLNMGKALYGDKFSVLPLGVDLTLFNNKCNRHIKRQLVLGVGTLYPAKRPEVFLDMAKRFPHADFCWYGDGPLRISLVAETEKRNITNLVFPGTLSPTQLAVRLQGANIFILPSHSEGVPKVTQEAAACGVPVILFGFYEAPSVIDGRNGYVVWNDEQLMDRVDSLISQPGLADEMGKVGAEIAQESWDWDKVAPLWESKIVKNISNVERN